MCNTCHKTVCCCTKVISKQGLTGPPGPPGPSASLRASAVFAATSSGILNPIPDTTPTVVPGMTLSLTAGVYIADADVTLQIDSAGTGQRRTVEYGIYQNGTIIASSFRTTDVIFLQDGGTLNYLFGNASTRTIKFTLTSSGTVDFRVYTDPSAVTRVAKCLGGTIRVIKLG